MRTRNVGILGTSLALIGLICLEGCAAVSRIGSPNYPEGMVFRDCAVCPEVVVVSPGSFLMGSPATEEGHAEYEGPQVEVEVESPMAVGLYEVTFAEWNACVDAGACGGHEPDDEGWGGGRHPVINVSWLDAQEYLEWLNEGTGYEYRLLREAEWEYVARAGTATARYWGESGSDQCRFANGGDGEAPCPDGSPNTAAVGTFEPNALGLYDVLGNVWEWTESCPDSYSNMRDGRPGNAGNCPERVVRGGSWFGGPLSLRSASRGWYPAAARRNEVGFRVARELE